MSKQITEEMDVHKEWYEEAKKQTAETLPEFVRKLTEDYEHDYGTICHALAAAAIGAAEAVEHSPQGGITGFQASAVMWQFIMEWMSYKDQPLRLIQYNEMLYPQYEEKFRTISKDTADWLKKEAKKKLKESNGTMAESVQTHLWKIAEEDYIPFGLGVSAR